MKRKSPPRTPSKAHSLVPFSGTHWGTVLVSAPVTQHFPHSTFSLPIAFAFPFCLQLSFAWGKWAVASQALKKYIYFHPPCRWCITNLLYLYLRQGMPLSVHLDLNSGFYIWYEHKIILTLTLKNKPPWCFFFLWAQCIWNLSAACTKGRSVVDKQLLLPLTLSQGDVMQVKKKKQSGAAEPDTAQVASQPHSAASPLINLSPLFSFLIPPLPSGSSAHLWESHHFTVWCSRIPRSLTAQEEKANVLFQWRTVCFYAILIPTQYFKYSCKMVFEIALHAFDIQL